MGNIPGFIVISGDRSVCLHVVNLIHTWLQPGVTGDLLISEPFQRFTVKPLKRLGSCRRFMITALKCGVNEKFLLTFLVFPCLCFTRDPYRRKLPPIKYLS